MTIEFHFPAFHFRIVLNGIYRVNDSIVPIIEILLSVRCHCEYGRID